MPLPMGLSGPDEASKKKRLRRGVTSCIECKKRKIRCVFPSAADAACIGCQRRGTACRSQEFDDEASIADESLSVRARLLRVETLVGKLIERAVPDEEERREFQLVVNWHADTNSLGAQDSDAGVRASLNGPTHSADERPAVHPSTTMHASIIPQLQPHGSSRHEGLSETLHEALPPQETIDTLLGNGRITVYLQALCNSYSEVFNGRFQASPDLASRPAISSHPVLLARKLLQLAVAIQQLDPSFKDASLNLTESLPACMARYVDLVSSLVTNNETLMDSVEAMECFILQGVYLINSACLRRAWLCFRRATSLAQIMGLHKGTFKAFKTLDPDTKVSYSIIWFRVVYAERYLSLLLGLPSGISDNSFASEENMLGATSTERLDRVHAVVCLQIMQRNDKRAYQDFTATSKIDFSLQRIAKSIDAKWWLQLNLRPEMSLPDMMDGVIRAQTQIIHQSLLILLHLPFVLRDASEPRFTYSKSACAHSSRDLLSRWITFRGFVRIVSCCRWLDFCAYTAALTLLLTHIDSHANRLDNPVRDLRLDDRALVETALNTMDELNRVNGDPVTKKTAELTRNLLKLELYASQGTSTYTAKVMRDETADDIDHDHALRVEIPYFGLVVISHEGRVPPESYPVLDQSTSSVACMSDTPQTFTRPLSSASSSDHYNQLNIPGQVSLGGWQSSTNHAVVEHAQLTDFSAPLLQFEGNFASQNIAMTDWIGEENDWPLQGVDATFFDAILKNNLPNAVPAGSLDRGWDDWDTM